MPTVHYLPRNFLTTQRGTKVPLVSVTVVPSSFNSRKRKRYFKSSYLSLEGNEDLQSNSNNFVFSQPRPRRSKSSKKTAIVTPQGKGEGGRRSANNGAAEYKLSSNNDSEVSDDATTNGSVEEDDDNDSLPLMHLYRKEKDVAASWKSAISEEDNAVEGEDDLPLKEVWRKARRSEKPKLLHDATKSSDKGYKKIVSRSPPSSAPSTDSADGKELRPSNNAKPDGVLTNTAANNGGNSNKVYFN